MFSNNSDEATINTESNHQHDNERGPLNIPILDNEYEFEDDGCIDEENSTGYGRSNFTDNIISESDESDVDEPEYEDNSDCTYNQALYDGAPLSVRDSMLLVMNLSIKHKLPDTCISDVFTVINAHCISKNLKKLSLYKYQKFFKCENQSVTKHYYCCKCDKALKIDEKICNECQQQTNSNYFITLSIVDQLQVILTPENLFQLLNHRFNRIKQNNSCIEEFYDGTIYKTEFVGNFLTNPHNLSLTWYTDGVPVFKCSRISIWPLYFRINELPYTVRIRRENTVLAGLLYLKTEK